jgi:hypothetical protein
MYLATPEILITVNNTIAINEIVTSLVNVHQLL